MNSKINQIFDQEFVRTIIIIDYDAISKFKLNGLQILQYTNIVIFQQKAHS